MVSKLVGTVDGYTGVLGWDGVLLSVTSDAAQHLSFRPRTRQRPEQIDGVPGCQTYMTRYWSERGSQNLQTYVLD